MCGEWLFHAVGTLYILPHEPFVAFDLMTDIKRKSLNEVKQRVERLDFTIPYTVSIGPAMSVKYALSFLGTYGNHGAIEPVEGLIYRVERKSEVDFILKYVKQGKENGIYLPEISGKEAIENKIIKFEKCD